MRKFLLFIYIFLLLCTGCQSSPTASETIFSAETFANTEDESIAGQNKLVVYSDECFIINTEVDNFPSEAAILQAKSHIWAIEDIEKSFLPQQAILNPLNHENFNYFGLDTFTESKTGTAIENGKNYEIFISNTGWNGRFYIDKTASKYDGAFFADSDNNHSNIEGLSVTNETAIDIANTAIEEFAPDITKEFRECISNVSDKENLFSNYLIKYNITFKDIPVYDLFYSPSDSNERIVIGNHIYVTITDMVVGFEMCLFDILTQGENQKLLSAQEATSFLQNSSIFINHQSSDNPIKISKVSLQYVPELIPFEYEKYNLVPCWIFEQLDTGQFVMVNAINGKIVE